MPAVPRPPRFWIDGGGTIGAVLFPLLLSPLGAITAAVTARRVARKGFAAPVPVLCSGNLTLGGTGKTILALDLAARLISRGVSVHILTRGYGGTAHGPLRVEADHLASLVGDEALLLAAAAPVWVGANRGLSARAALAEGAEALIMDDGLQNPTLEKSFSFVVIDGGVGFGNSRVFPAGPLREPIAAGVRRGHAAVLIGEDRTNACQFIPRDLPVLRARLVPGPEARRLAGARVVAFAGIGRPEKFFASLEEAGAFVLARRAFPDHHRYRRAEIEPLVAAAERKGAIAVTTAKDRVRLPAAMRDRVEVLSVQLAWDEPGRLEALLAPLFPWALAR